MLIRIDQFGGVAPKISPHLLPQQLATVANNCRFGSGALEAWNQPSAVASLSKSGTKKSLYHYNDSFWFHWLEDVDVVQAPVALDAYGRVYWTGEGYPRVGGSDVVTSGGGTGYPTASYHMGVPAPTTIPSAVVSGSATDTAPPKERSYVFTYVNAYGGEGPPSDPSNLVDVGTGQAVTLTLPNETLTNYNVVLKNIYRTETGSTTSEWLLVGTVSLATTSFIDDRAAESLSTIMPSLDWNPPPDDLKGLVDHPCGSLVGFSGKELYFSEPFRPHAWPYRYAMSDTIVAIGVYGTSVLVTTTGKPYIVSGSDPSSMTRERIERGEACVSKRGLVDMGVACIYPGPSGLWGASLSSVSLLTEKIMGIDDWQKYKPESILGTFYNGQYIGFYDTGSKQAGFIFDPNTGDFTDIDTYATARWNDPKTGKLYLVVSGAVVQWDGSATPISVTWRSRPYIATHPLNFACAKVEADSYPVTCKFYADGALKHTQTVASAAPFWLPAGFRAIKWEAEISGTAKVNAISIAGSMKELEA